MTNQWSFEKVTLPPISSITSFEESWSSPTHNSDPMKQLQRTNSAGSATTISTAIPTTPQHLLPQSQVYHPQPQLHRMESQPRISPPLMSLQASTQQSPRLHSQQINTQQHMMPLNPQMRSPLAFNTHQMVPVSNQANSPRNDPSQLPPQQQQQQLQLIAIDPRFPVQYHPHQGHPQGHPVALSHPHHPMEIPLYYPPPDMYVPYGQQYLPRELGFPERRPVVRRRTRTGCLTCRKRRVKCDERKPFCYNCERSRKVCSGYENPAFVKFKSKRGKKDDSNSTSSIDSIANSNDGSENNSFTASPENTNVEPRIDSDKKERENAQAGSGSSSNTKVQDVKEADTGISDRQADPGQHLPPKVGFLVN
ncbi:unnamed protein product [Kuraishia capsulata CBS 1993]|uniref:Zn(2)-C6 fungal-type domain-containing protein n=1 Tax=Kuraishia capsulata CBS 1993 TaxID=1382522 RepID=W6MJT5_9ASCO|nr:uncharacterized protein KUCA_T00002773001 [Kuraishia capsulata CBS 1993]CDK26799.1 unnamed protein product [Kuraishia capsulata CBS 1993]